MSPLLSKSMLVVIFKATLADPCKQCLLEAEFPCLRLFLALCCKAVGARLVLCVYQYNKGSKTICGHAEPLCLVKLTGGIQVTSAHYTSKLIVMTLMLLVTTPKKGK